ncbi:GapS6b family protein [Citrobacter braakii]|uniref:GapS6b family protein n=1 Tax=Citrobacter braakii TaxID=57706 RepID=UPI0006655D20|nr:hypothetical protein [Citrobacter braakii]
MMVNQEHNGSGDNVAGNKYEYIIRNIQSRDLIAVIDDIMHDICYRDLVKAREKLDVLNNISSLEYDVSLLLKSLNIKLDLVKGYTPSSKNDLVNLLQYKSLSKEIREVVTSILIDFESRNDEDLARERYLTSNADGKYIKEIFFERLASKEELLANYKDSIAYELSEQEITGLIRGAIRVEDCELSFEFSHLLDKYFPSSNSKALLLYTESCLVIERNLHKQYISFGKQEKENVDRLIDKFLEDNSDRSTSRQIAILTNLMHVTCFMDGRLIDLGKAYVNEIRKMSPATADILEQIDTKLLIPNKNFELSSNSLDLDQFAHLDYALEHNYVKIRDVHKWINQGGVIRTGDEYLNGFFDLYLSALVCSSANRYEVQKLEEKAQEFLEEDSDRFKQINPSSILKLCERFIQLNLPLSAVTYLSPFLSDDAWVSPTFECYLNALFLSEKFDLFLSKIKHLQPKDKTQLIYIREAEIFERMDKNELSINLIRSAIDIYPNNPYPWYLLLRTSRKNGANVDALREIVFEIPVAILSNFHESSVALVNEIATHVDISLAERILVDWFVQNPTKVAKPFTQIHTNTLIKRPDDHSNPYTPLKCGDGVIYSDGFETFTRILVRDVDANHPHLLNIDSPLGKILENMQQGESCKGYTMLERLPPYVAAIRLAVELRSKSNDGTDAFRQFSLPSNEEDFIPYFESIIRHYDSQDKEIDALVHGPTVPLTIRGKFTSPSDPVRGALNNLTALASAKYLALFNDGEENPEKVIIDVYTAIYLSLMGFSSSVANLDVAIVVSQYTKDILEGWVENILREDYLSIGVTDKGIYRVTSKDIRENSIELIHELQVLLEHVTVEAMKPVDTPELLVKIRDMVDESMYSAFQLSVANNIPLLCIDHLMCELIYRSGFPVANMNSLIMKVLYSLTLPERKKSIQISLTSGTPVPILYSDILEMSVSSNNSDAYLVFKFMEKYGGIIKATGAPLEFLTTIVRNVTVLACIDKTILSGGRALNPQYEGYAEHIFNFCCRSAMLTLEGDTSEKRLALLIENLLSTTRLVRKYLKLISLLTSEFAQGHFLDFEACNDALVACRTDRQAREQENREVI